ncbi:MAG: threonine synthase [Chloroflexi bacterium]|nr:threonine synthase [Chloroflexota bacterium]
MDYAESALTHLKCPECHKIFNADEVQTYCQDCRSPLIACYDLNIAKKTLTREALQARSRGIWRWGEILPVRAQAQRLTLGEADTPLLPATNLGKSLGMNELYIKDESNNPTGSFKARGLVVAVARAMELGVRGFVIPTAGNAGGALAAYAARARAQAHVFMPKDAPIANQIEVKIAGAELVLVDGLISDAAKLASEAAKQNDWFDISTFKEPYRCEGKKTMGLELAEAFGWNLPDVIIYPTGGGTGLVGMWKAFAELEQMGFIGAKRPRMVSVQADGCAPIVRAFNENSERCVFWEGAETIASGLRVPGVFADRMILRAIRASMGTALTVSDTEILACQKEIAACEGIFAAPEGAASLAAIKKLLANGWIDKQERVILFNTGSGLKYLQ